MDDFREFLKNECLVKMKLLTGFTQFERIAASDQRQEMTKELLDMITQVCNQFGLISNEEKKQIIKHQMVSDDGFKGFNAAILTKWFIKHMNQHKEMYAQRSNENAADVAREERNKRFYQQQLEKKRKENPNYDPKREALGRIPVEVKNHGKSMGERLKESLK